MAKILSVTAANEQKGDPQTESLLEERSVKWCVKYLQLGGDPIPLLTEVQIHRDPRDRGGTKVVFVKVSENESGLVRPGFYPIEKSPADVNGILRTNPELT